MPRPGVYLLFCNFLSVSSLSALRDEDRAEPVRDPALVLISATLSAQSWMTWRPRVEPSPATLVPQRMTLTPTEAATVLGVSRSFFYTHILPELRVIRIGRKRLIAMRELERWTERESVGVFS